MKQTMAAEIKVNRGKVSSMLRSGDKRSET